MSEPSYYPLAEKSVYTKLKRASDVVQSLRMIIARMESRYNSCSVVRNAIQYTTNMHCRSDPRREPPNDASKLHLPPVKRRGLHIEVTSAVRVLGFTLSCNGDTGQDRAKMMGVLRNRLATMKSRLSAARPVQRAWWWKDSCVLLYVSAQTILTPESCPTAGQLF